MKGAGFRLNNIALTHRVWAVMLVNMLAILLLMALSGWGLLQARTSLSSLHSERMAVAEHVRALVQSTYDTRQNILLGFQHDPDSPLYLIHDHPLSLHTNAAANSQQEWEAHWAALLTFQMDDIEANLIEQASNQQNHWADEANYAVDRLTASNFSPAVMERFLAAGRDHADTLLGTLVELQEYQAIKADEAVLAAEQRFQSILVAFALFVVFIMLPGAIFMLATLRRLSAGFRRAVQLSEAIAQGDLSRHDDDNARDEIGTLITQMQAMRGNLSSLIQRIVRGADMIADAATDVATGTQALSERTVQQAAALEETSAGSEELNATVHQNADNASQVNTMANDTAQLAEQGGQVTNRAVNTMEEIRTASEKIGEIVNLIDDIAFQTNILALNAAVEAARAGESGRGFAVVAGEVRALAQRSATAALEIKQVVTETVERIREGSDEVSHAGTSMTEIVDSFRRMTTLIGEIANASKEQAVGLQQINQAVNDMDGATQRNAALVDETLRTSGILQQQAAEFRALVSTFQLADTPQPVSQTALPPAPSSPALGLPSP